MPKVMRKRAKAEQPGAAGKPGVNGQMAQPRLGTPLSEDDFKQGRVLTVQDTPRAEYAWDTGPAVGRYLEELKNGRLVGRRCRVCDRILVPPRIFCELCFRYNDEWVVLKDTGTVNTFSLCFVTWDMQKLEHPQIPAVIEIDGASPGMGILHLLGNVDPKKVKTGMRVRAVWKPPEERTGAITDIRFWEPGK